MISYILASLGDFDINMELSKFTLSMYVLFAHIGGMGFALLGEVPGLNIVITKNFWNRLTPIDIVALVVLGIPIVYVMIREFIDSCRNCEIGFQLSKIMSFAIAYVSLFLLFVFNKDHSIQYHVHHAIFAGMLSLWFVEWDRKSIMWTNAAMIGITTEGLNFYGIGELFLFLSSGNLSLKFATTTMIAVGFIVGFMILVCLRCKPIQSFVYNQGHGINPV